MLPLVFAAAGTAGGAADALASEAIIGNYGSEVVGCAWIGGGIGLGIGVALVLSRRAWIGVPLSPILGAAGYLMAGITFSSLEGRPEFPSLGNLSRDEFLKLLAAVAAPVLVFAHHLWLRWEAVRRSSPRSVVLFAVLGAVSGAAFWAKMSNAGGEFAMGLLNGAIYGVFQYAAVRVARTMACGRGPGEGARTPSS
jgi:hypothetical protein